MANPHKGEVSFKAGDKDYKLSYSANALCELEEALGKSFEECFELMRSGKVRMSDLRVMFWQGLRDHQPDTSLDDAKAILKTMKPIELGRLVGEGIVASMPDDEAAPAKNPPQPDSPKKIGTGPAS